MAGEVLPALPTLDDSQDENQPGLPNDGRFETPLTGKRRILSEGFA